MDIQLLSTSERILLAEKLWDSVRENSDQVELTPEHVEVLNERLDALSTDGDKGESWDIVKKRISNQ